MVGEGAASSSSAVPGVQQAASASLPLQFYQGMLQYPVTIASVLPPQFAVPATVAPSSSPFSEAAQIFGASCVQPPRVTGAAGGPISGACGQSLFKGAPLGLGYNYAGGATTTTPSSGVVFRPPPASNWASGLGPPLPPPPGVAVVGPNINAPASALAVRSTLSAWQHAQRRVYPDALLQHFFQHQGDAIKVHAMEDSLAGDIKALGEQGYLMSGHPGLGCSVSDSAVLDIAAPVEQQTSERENVEVVNQQFDVEERIVASEHDVPSGHTGWEDADGENCGDLSGLLKALSEEPGSPICLDAHDVDMCDQPPELSMGQPSEQLCEQPFEQPCEASVLHTKVIKCEADMPVPDLDCRASKEASIQNMGDLSSFVIVLDSDGEDDESVKVSDRKASPGPHNHIHEGVLGLEWTKVETGMSKGKGEANVKEEEAVRDDKIEEGEFVLSSITASGGFQHPDPMPFAQIPQNIQEAGLYSRPTQATRSDMRPTLGVNKDSHHGKQRSHLAVLRKQFKESLQGFRISAGSLKAMGIGVTSAQERCSLQMVPHSGMGASGLPIASRSSCVGTKGPTDGGLPVDRNPSVKGIQIPTYMEHSVQVVPIKTEYNDSTLSTDRDIVLSTLRSYSRHLRQCKLDELHFQMASMAQNHPENPLVPLPIVGRNRADIEAYNRVKDELKLPKFILGEVPGIEIGDIYTYRHEMAVVGLHHLPNVGIAYGPHPVDGTPTATAVVICPKGFYSDNIDEGYRVLYCGQGGRPDRSQSSQVTVDQKYEKGNRALCMNYDRGLPVRLIRAHSSGGSSSAKGKTIGYTYDGLYRIIHREHSPGSSGTLVYKFGLERIGNQPPIPPCLIGCTEHAWNFREIDLAPIPLQVSAPIEEVNVRQIEL